MTFRPAELLEQAEALEREAREWIEPPDHPAHNEADRLVHALAEMNLALAVRFRDASDA